jgi:hypothetical protein
MHRCIQHIYGNCGGVQLTIVIEMFELERVFKQMRNKSHTTVGDRLEQKINAALVESDVRNLQLLVASAEVTRAMAHDQ